MKKQRINLIPLEMRPQVTLSYDVALYIFAALVLLSVSASWFGGVHSTHVRAAENTRLTQTRDELIKKVANLGAGAYSVLDAKSAASLKPLEDVLKNKTVWSEPFKELSGLVPPGVWISKLAAGYDKQNERFMTITGSAPSEQKVAEFFTSLEQSFYFRRVNIRYSERLKEIAPQLYNFEFSVPLKVNAPGRVVANETH